MRLNSWILEAFLETKLKANITEELKGKIREGECSLDT